MVKLNGVGCACGPPGPASHQTTTTMMGALSDIGGLSRVPAIRLLHRLH